MQTNYPELKFIDTTLPELQIVNEPDFKLNKLLERVGIKGLDVTSTTDRRELIARQDVFKFLFENPEFAKWARNGIRSDKISKEPETFLKELNPDTEHGSQFLDELHVGMELLKGKALPERLAVFYGFLTGTFIDASNTENALSKNVSEKVLKSSKFWGKYTISVDIDRNVSGSDFSGGGYRLYGYNWREGRLWNFSKKWTEMSVIGYILSLVEDIHNQRVERKRYGPQTISADNLRSHAITNLLRKTVQESLPTPAKWKRAWENGLDAGSTIRLEVYIGFENGRVHVRILDVSIRDDLGYLAKASSNQKITIPDGFGGYTKDIQKEMKLLQERLSSLSWNTGFQEVAKMHAHASFATSPKMLNLFGEGTYIEDPNLTQSFGGVDIIRGLFDTKLNPEICKAYAEANTYRSWVKAKIQDLNHMAYVLEQMETKSKQWKIPLTFPKVLPEDSHEIAVSDIYPISLIGRTDMHGSIIKAKQLVPVSGLPKLNGVPVGLTGQNAGGKTVSAEEIAWSVWLAQAGLPIFGKGFALNPKRVLAPVFIERGAGSTAQLLVQKLQKVVAAAKANEPHHVLAIIDELGGATGFDDGTILGKQVLTALKASGCSVMFNTQLHGVAEFARDNLDALIFQVDLSHKIVPGIGKSNIQALVDSEGLSADLPSPEQFMTSGEHVN